MSSSAIFLETIDLRKDYLTGDQDLPILKGVNLALESGNMHFIIGRSGSGKSTLMHLLGGLDRPTAGRILFEGNDMGEMRENELAKIRNKRIGFVFQFYHLVAELTALENVMLPSLMSREAPGARSAARQRAETLLERLGLEKRLEHFPSELSGGEQQRVAIARALVNDPGIIFCDEPTGNLDAENGRNVVELLREVFHDGHRTLILVTHDPSVAGLADRIWDMKEQKWREG